MCQERNEFVFCTCSEKNEDFGTSQTLSNYSWSLSKYLGNKVSSLAGKIVIPKIQESFNWFLKPDIHRQLNSRFDLQIFLLS